MTARLPVYMSLDEFLAWDSGDGRRYELVDGVPREMAPTILVHGLLQSELGSLIGNHLRESGSRCLVIANPGVVPRMMSAHNFRIPDLGVMCAPLQPGQVMITEPVLLVEVLSPSNQSDTWSNVWSYTSIPGLQEILVLHATRVLAELLRRDREGKWPDEPTPYRQGNLELASIDFEVPLAELYAGSGLPLP
jgi:Uma2 family endonuclease